MRTILAPVERHARIEATLETALRLAGLFGSHIEGFAALHDLRLLLPAEAPGGLVFAEQAPEVYEREEEACRAIFEHAMRLGGARPEGASPPGSAVREDADASGKAVTHGWTAARARGGDAALGAYGRVFDVTVVGRPGPTSEGPRMGLLEAALFESGRPILIAPPEPPSSLGRRVAIDWNGSPETARAVAFARPLLARAEAVSVLSIAGGRGPEPDAEQLVRHLHRNGLRAEARAMDVANESRGPALLEEAARLGCDLLVKGAYTQSRLRQMIFGGATRHVLANAALPVFMAH